jgi:hypothetical protein
MQKKHILAPQWAIDRMCKVVFNSIIGAGSTQ